MNYTHTEIIVNVFGPIIDLSKIPEFSSIDLINHMRHEKLKETFDILYPKNSCTLEKPDPWRESDYRNIIWNSLRDDRLKTQLINRDVLKLICDAQEFALVKIMVKYPADNIEVEYELLKKLIIDCSERLVEYDQIKKGCFLTESNFFNAGKVISEGKKDYFKEICPKPGDNYHIVEKNGREEKVVGNNPYRIVLDFNVDFNVPKTNENGNSNWHWWISGKINNECPATKLKDLIAIRKLGFETTKFIQKIEKENNEIKINDYSTKLFSDEYYVANPELKDDLDAQTYFLEETSKSLLFPQKPTCVFLAGDPGTGKSYFIDLLAKKLKISYFPSISLSEVKDDNFQNAIQKHIDEVYNAHKPSPLKHKLAFVDEIDTNAKGLAFRLFLEAMTGKYRNSDGEALDYETNHLIWVFAGSTNTKKTDFIQMFEKEEKKVRDFFDRIHFYLELPSVRNSADQAILHFLSMVKKYQKEHKKRKGENADRIKISKSVLALLGLTPWKSARQIDTIIKAASVSMKDFDTIKLRHFINITHVDEFCKTFSRITSGVSNTIPPTKIERGFVQKELKKFENRNEIKSLKEKENLVTIIY